MLQRKFRKFIDDNRLFHPEDSLLVAVSGGVDSMTLCRLLALENYDFSVAHCNFQLRGEESEADGAFVKNNFGTDNRRMFIKTFDTAVYAKKYKTGVQEAARNLRYEWFDELCKLYHFKYILTAHHADDSIETLFINFVKGTGLHGFHGILPKNGKVVRPLLCALKSEIEEFAQLNHISFREDSSNLSDKYTRNFIRLQVTPYFQVLNPSFEQTALENIERFKEAEAVYNWAIEKMKEEAADFDGETIRINKAAIYRSPAPATVLYEIIKIYGFNSAQAKDILRRNASGRMFYSSGYSLLADREYYYIRASKEESETEQALEIDALRGSWKAPDAYFEWKVAEAEEVYKNMEPSNAFFDVGQLIFPLRFRRWKAGDSFQPSGLEGKTQKLSDFFNNMKLSKFAKEKVWILETGSGEICWIAGLRIDHRFKAGNDTAKILKFSIQRLPVFATGLAIKDSDARRL